MSPLFAYFSHDCWVICKRRPASVWEALQTGNYVGTSFLREPPAEWDGVPVYVSHGIDTWRAA